MLAKILRLGYHTPPFASGIVEALRDFATRVGSQEGSTFPDTREGPSIWGEALCCPGEGQSNRVPGNSRWKLGMTFENLISIPARERLPDSSLPQC